ncbi:MAG: MotA/TolQ/ExbB proton channel family protein [Candidatus Methylacidiphilales bacterium]|nr:MotA/TolQ/ExbB proton channel family protein [Candidatus Methylacidiphilales bacterium]
MKRIPILARFNLQLLTLLAFFLTLLPAMAAEDASGAPKDVKFYEIFITPGPKAVVMWILLLSSVVMLGLIVELFIRLRTAKLAPPAVVALLRDALVSGNYQQALDVCGANKCFLTAVMGPALASVTLGRYAVDEIVNEGFTQQSSRIKAKNNYLSVIGVVSPMVGLAGTVAGMMKAFAVLGQSGVANMTGLSSAISEVLIATLAGLVVAVPGFVFFYYFKNASTVVFADVHGEIRGLLRLIPFEQLQGLNLGLNANS